MKTYRSVTNYLSGVRDELTRVTWPKRDQVISFTAIVIIISAIVGIYVGGLDYIFTKLLEKVITY